MSKLQRDLFVLGISLSSYTPSTIPLILYETVFSPCPSNPHTLDRYDNYSLPPHRIDRIVDTIHSTTPWATCNAYHTEVCCPLLTRNGQQN